MKQTSVRERMSVNATFSKEFGFSGITAIVEFHY